MDNIQYDPERILNGFTIDVLKELAKRLKQKIRPTKSEIIQEILSHPRGKPEDMVKVWQEMNRYLRKELEAFSQDAFTMFSSGDVLREERFKVGYMFTLSSNSEIRTLGEEFYCRRAEEDKALDNGAFSIWKERIISQIFGLMFLITTFILDRLLSMPNTVND